MKGINLHLYTSNFTHETRMLKETKSLSDAALFDQILIAAIWAEGLAESEVVDHGRLLWRIKLTARFLPKIPFAAGVRILEWYFRVLSRYLFGTVSVVSAHSLAVLPLALLFKLFRGARVVYEAHELETERNGWSKTTRALARTVERRLIRYVDQIVVVGDSIGAWYRKNYGLENVTVVKNIPSTVPNLSYPRPGPIRQKFELGNEDLVFIYQGILSSGRFISPLLEIFAKLPDRHLVLMGYGRLQPLIEDYQSKYNNIHFHPAVPPDQTMNYTPDADVGLAVFENTSLSYYYSAPNKLFEYILSGVPPIVSDFPDMAAIVDTHSLGWKTSTDSAKVEDLIRSIDGNGIAEKKKNLFASRSKFSWRDEAVKLVAAYQATFGRETLESLEPSQARD